MSTVAAISTAQGQGGIGVIRISGKNSFEITDKIFKSVSGKKVADIKGYTALFGHIFRDNEKIDEVVVLKFVAPKSFTGENVVEISCHGGMYITREVLKCVIDAGATLAQPGEFTKRAYLNGKMDLTEAESVMDIINSKNNFALQSSMSQLQGSLQEEIKNLREKIIYEIAFIESALDDPENYDTEGYGEKLYSVVKDIKNQIHDLILKSDNGKMLKEGIKTVILGKPNAGKSSFLNRLVGEEKAIVTNIAGTTRDTLEETIRLNGISLQLIDTAGIRETEDIVEKIGVDKSKEEALNADLIILVLNNNEKISQEDLELLNINSNVNKIVFINKCDLDKKIDESKLEGNIIVRGNTIDTYGLDELKNKIKEMFNLNKINTGDYNYLSNARQIALVKNALESIENAMTSAENEVPLEMIAQDISDAYSTLGEIIGSTYKDELLDELFSKFCLGK